MNDSRFRPRNTPPVHLGPVAKEAPQAQPRPIDKYLGDLYGPGEPLLSLIEAEPMERQPLKTKFPLTMWLWAAGTAAAAILTIFLILG